MLQRGGAGLSSPRPWRCAEREGLWAPTDSASDGSAGEEAEEEDGESAEHRLSHRSGSLSCAEAACALDIELPQIRERGSDIVALGCYQFRRQGESDGLPDVPAVRRFRVSEQQPPEHYR